MIDKLEKQLHELEKELNESRKRYLRINNIKSKEYKEAKKEYFNLAEEYSALFNKHMNGQSKGADWWRK